MQHLGKENVDLAAERRRATIDIEKMKLFMGSQMCGSVETYQRLIAIRRKLVTEIKPLFEENYNNLDRNEKYLMVCDKSLRMIEFAKANHCEDAMFPSAIGAIMGTEKVLFALHYTMFNDAIDVWGTPEQSAYWKAFVASNGVFGTYVQTEIGHGTYLRGLETTATYDKATQEFVLNSPTLTSTKFWPGASAKTSNHAIVMAKLIMDGEDMGVHAFIVQLRSLVDHTAMPGLEVGDIGKKLGFESTDNGYLRFTHMRIPRLNMLMKFSRVTADGKFERLGNELLMYAAMLLMRGGSLPLQGSYWLSVSTTIATRYSCVRRQTVDDKGVELQVMDYQTQQYRVLVSLASAYAFSFTAWTFKKMLTFITQKGFQSVNPSDLAKLHAVSSGLKSVIYSDSLKNAQSDRLCCGGHGYSASSGFAQVIQELDAGCSYEGDNVVLLLQTARYLLKCTQKLISPHLELINIEKIKASALYAHFQKYIEILERLFEESVNEISGIMLQAIKEDNTPLLKAWNQSSQRLISAARVYTEIFIVYANLAGVYANDVPANQQATAQLFELYLLHAICDTYSGNILRFNILDSTQMTEYMDAMYKLLPLIRVNAVALVDAFDLLDSNLCSSLGAYDGQAYERLLDFAKKSKFNDKDVHDVYHKYLKPFANQVKAKL